MSFKNVPIPAAAEAAGYTNLAIADDFDDLSQFDMTGSGEPGYTWYIDRPGGKPDMKPTDFSFPEESVLHLAPEMCRPLIGFSSYSKRGDTGYTMQYGYLEARIRVKHPGEVYQKSVHCWPAFWTLSKQNWMGKRFDHCGEIDVVEMVAIHKGHPIYTGSLHDWKRIRDEEGKVVKTEFASNLINNCGYNDYFTYIDEDWHTYAVLWEPGHIAWYWDNKLMHSIRFNEWDKPQYFFRDDPTPLPSLSYYASGVRNAPWKGAYHVFENDPQVITAGCRGEWPMDIDWIRVWDKK